MSALAPVARVTDFRNMVQFGPTDEDNYIFCPRKDRKFVYVARFVRTGSAFSGVGFQRPGLSGPTQAPPASTVSRVENQCAHKDVRPNEERIDVLGAVKTRSTRVESGTRRAPDVHEEEEEEEPKRIDKSEEGGKMRNIGDAESPSRTGR